uniref:Uncharacterized protein n=1 Tax=Romanomermis culicivorax TaxID=13658 RepID=A0A915L3H3_ROMCU
MLRRRSFVLKMSSIGRGTRFKTSEISTRLCLSMPDTIEFQLLEQTMQANKAYKSSPTLRCFPASRIPIKSAFINESHSLE